MFGRKVKKKKKIEKLSKELLAAMSARDKELARQIRDELDMVQFPNVRKMLRRRIGLER